jgi:hypothetical protein
VPIFETGIQQVSSSVGTVAAIIWDPNNTSTTTYGPLGSVASTATLKDVTIQNTGANPLYVGFGSASAAATTGLKVEAGGQVVLYGYSATGGSTTGRIWGQTAVVGSTTSCIAGLASIQNAVV